MTQQDVVIVGGGISGLAAAWELSTRNPQLTISVVDAAARCGGVLAPTTLCVSSTDEFVTVDGGAEAVLNVRPEAVGLIREIGLGNQLVYPHTTHALIASHGVCHPMPRGTVMGIPTDVDSCADILTDDELVAAREQAAKPLSAVAEDLSVAEWVTSRYGQAVTDRLVEPLLGGVYAGRAEQLSLQATVPTAWQAAVAGQPLTSTSATGPAGTATKQPVPVFAGVIGGVHRIADVLVEQLTGRGVTIQNHCPVSRIERDGRSWRVTTDVGQLTSRAVILAVQPDVAGTLLVDECPVAAGILRDVPLASMALVTMVVPVEQLSDVEFSGLLVPPVEGSLIKAATFSSRKWAWVNDQYPQYSVVRMSVGRVGEPAPDDDDELVGCAVSNLSKLIGRHLEPLAHNVTRWRNALPQYTVGHVDRMRAVQAEVAAVPGLAVIGSMYDGVGIAACIGHARTQAAALRGGDGETLCQM